MSHPTPSREPSKNGVPKRPSTIAELAEKAMIEIWDDSRDFKHYLRDAEKHRREGKEFARRGDIENAFVELARAATLVLEKLPTHRDYNTVLNANQRHNLALNGQDILDNLTDLKVRIVDRYDKWLSKHPDHADHERTPNARSQSIPDAAQRQQEVEKEQHRLIEEEATKWKLQRHQREEAERARQDQAAQAARAAEQRAVPPSRPPKAPDYTFSQTPMQKSGIGTQNTVVIADGRPADEVSRQQWQEQEQARLRQEAERRRLEEARKQEQEALARRQRELEESNRAARNLPPPPTMAIASPSIASQSSVSASPMFSTYSQTTAVTTPSSTYYHTPTRIEYPSVQAHNHNSIPPAQQPAVTRIMPLESPSEGDSTDSESLHYNNYRKPRPAEPRTPVRNIRSPMYPPPITTTSPVPNAGSIRYPTLMSPHQRMQGYFPSLNSMFTDFGDRHHAQGPGSMLLGLNLNDSRNAYPAPTVHSAPVHGSYPYSNGHSNGHSRPLPPTLPPPAAEVARLPKPTNAVFDPNVPLKVVSLPRECLPRFLAIAKVNTEMNRETCGLLLGKDKGNRYSVTTLLIPKQHSTSDTCTMDEEELVLQFTEERSLITLGWIHTHPSQSCFMSSVDLHTHSGFQRMLPESFAVVCAPKSNPNFGIFRLTDPPGLDIVLNCEAKEAFHPHPDEPIYTDADKGHVQMKDAALEIVDLR
ncbi:Mov34-domain-containing protein [Agrocybe pediades]|nr:Mov34-domain-containing protein [Agrocybe pediades]